MLKDLEAIVLFLDIDLNIYIGVTSKLIDMEDISKQYENIL
jgi:hypothetical protein